MSHRDEHVIIFQHRNFRGNHRHIFGYEANLNDKEDDALNDAVSSFVVLSGRWQFFRDADFKDPYRPTLGPGEYAWVEDYGIANDQISSLRSEG